MILKIVCTNFPMVWLMLKSLSKKIKKDEKLYKNILTFYIGYAGTNSVKPLYLFSSKISGYIKENNGKNIWY